MEAIKGNFHFHLFFASYIIYKFLFPQIQLCMPSVFMTNIGRLGNFDDLNEGSVKVKTVYPLLNSRHMRCPAIAISTAKGKLAYSISLPTPTFSEESLMLLQKEFEGSISRVCTFPYK